ncbi:hypothetical protein OHC33_009013 [Knufia fluminis]|uniref:Ankyrin repeat protein n=1 Tax=Knufia fluminis TaxID=191047 RepID=A0AAN8F2R8_9EURO|nr:hypothetical protein OHC33_009013 [Knufia fluminis]
MSTDAPSSSRERLNNPYPRQPESISSRHPKATFPSSGAPSERDKSAAPMVEGTRRYGPATISEHASAVLGDVVHNYNYFQSADAQKTSQALDTKPQLDLDTISDYDSRHALWLRSQPRVAGTCQWIDKAPEYRDWLSREGPPVLLCVGSVGCGKSITAGAVIASLDASRNEQALVTFFADPSSNHAITACDVVRAQIKQVYVDHEVAAKQLDRCITQDERLPQEIKDMLKANCAKMFLWVRLQILSIWDPNLTTCDDDIKAQLSSLPDGIDDIYIRCLRRIHTTNIQRSRDIAPRVFKWVSSAKQPLTDMQAREAVSMTTENLPLHKTMVLGSQVTDYCANLIVLDELTGTVAFPHPTVRDFLREPGKVPADLKHYQLSAQNDDLWCGELCLVYANIVQERKQIVIHRTQKISTDVVRPIAKTVLGSNMPSRWRGVGPNSSSTAVQISMPVATQRQGLMGKDFAMHEYLCRFWLAHNRNICPDAPMYSLFVDLCLGHNPDVQPWATDSSTVTVRYQRIVEFAIMHEHIPLLRLVVNHIRKRRISLVRSVFEGVCPGTDSSFLHIAAALGHEGVVTILLEVCRKDLADGSGHSPAAVAASGHHDKVFTLLLPEPRSVEDGGLWTLETTDKRPVSESLLRLCVVNGDAATLSWFLNSCPVHREAWAVPLNIAFMEACRAENLEICKSLIEVGHVDSSIINISPVYGDDSEWLVRLPPKHIPIMRKKRSSLLMRWSSAISN